MRTTVSVDADQLSMVIDAAKETAGQYTRLANDARSRGLTHPSTAINAWRQDILNACAELRRAVAHAEPNTAEQAGPDA